jgi:hypothetical protein
MTTWHENESLAEAIQFVLVAAMPDESYADGCGSTLGIAIGSSLWAAEMRSALSDCHRFIRQLDLET